MKNKEPEKDNVLVVEDEEDTRFILERLLSKNGYTVTSCRNGEEALSVLNSFKPKVIIADWTMPKMDGLELCNILKEKESTKFIYFIVLTARASLKDRVTGLDIGADDFLVKPIENQELLARIRSGIRIYNLQLELKNIEHDRAVVELATTLGHKINNPLSSLIMSFSSMESEMEKNETEKHKDDLFVINQSIERIKNFVEALKNLQNPEITKYALEKNMLKMDPED
ncbi:MAG: response regulator [Melioribacteraceae bacterium]|nr:response regulator [Melioribacteraceae bacterium]MCO6473356.1 response regulator [Melioribacteraceae bacterium]